MRFAGLWLCFLGVIACGTNPKPEPVPEAAEPCDGQCPRGHRCVVDEDGHFCSDECESDDDCDDDDFYCGVIDGDEHCIELCTTGQNISGDEYACVDNKYVSCDDIALGTYCSDCGCPMGSRCVGDVCEAIAKLGEPCDSDFDCESRYCSVVRRTCNVELGAECDETNCDLCDVFEDWSYCSRYCEDQSDCSSGQACLRGIEDPSFRCYATCRDGDDATCAEGECEDYFDDDSLDDAYYCACPYCDALEPLRAFGQACWADAHCASGTCAQPHAASGFEGWCLDACSSDDECVEGARCVGNQCMAECQPAMPQCKFTCRGVEVAGESVNVCDPRRDSNWSCSSDDHCRTGHCVDEVCAPE